MMRYLMIGAGLLGLAACAQQAPISNAAAGGGVGFGDYTEFERQRLVRQEQLAEGPSVQPNQTVLPPTGQSGTPGAAISSGELAAAGIGQPLGTVPTAPDHNAGTVNNSVPVRGADATPTDANRNAGGISDEQDFDAVSARETMESDAQRMERNAAAYRVIQPTAVPDRPGRGVNIVAYALHTTNLPGQPVVTRGPSFNAEAKYVRNCSRFASADLAQQAFLARGGPEADPLGMDPDGDGFACGWDPQPFRLAVQAG